jgi:hypothetical protein
VSGDPSQLVVDAWRAALRGPWPDHTLTHPASLRDLRQFLLDGVRF